MEALAPALAFIRLSPDELAALADIAARRTLEPFEPVFQAGDPDPGFVVVESGTLHIWPPGPHAAPDVDSPLATHGPGEFAGDIDVLTGRPSLVGAAAGAHGAVVLRTPAAEGKRLLVTLPRLGEKMLLAFQARRQALERAGVIAARVVGPGSCADTHRLREFLHRNGVPFAWTQTDAEMKPGAPDSAANDGAASMTSVMPATTASAAPALAPPPDVRPEDLPIVVCPGGVMQRPSLADAAKCLGLRRACPDQVFDLAVVGAGPAGLSAAVYAASEGLATIVLDAMGPGGQAGGSSLIENLVGFPSGLSGVELGQRAMLQLVKFGGQMFAPARAASVERAEPAGREDGRDGGRGEERSRTRSGGCDEQGPLLIRTHEGDEIRAHVVLASTGVRWRRLGAPGVDRFERSGVHYSATSVESRLCAGKAVAVVGGGNSAGQAAMYLSECAARVHLVVREKHLGAHMSDYLAERLRASPRVTIHEGVEVGEARGGSCLEAIALRPAAKDDASGAGDAGAAQEVVSLDCAALFVFIGAEPHAAWLPQSVARDEKGYLLAGDEAKAHALWTLGRSPQPLETTLPGLLVAGDLRAGSVKRIGAAIGDGSLAVTCVHRLVRQGAAGRQRVRAAAS